MGICYTFSFPEELPDPKSILIVAFPNKFINRIKFSWKGGKVELILPPGYDIKETLRDESVRSCLKGFLDRNNYRLAPSRIPEKLLAVRSGLGEYGRNCLCYVEGMGSFQNLVVYYTDIPCSDDEWYELKVMDICGKCNICRKSCPTGAIGDDRYLLHGEKCLTYLNERGDTFPGWEKCYDFNYGDYPEWADMASHDCIIGCVKCQINCPRNKNLVTWYDYPDEFTEEETGIIISNTQPDSLPSGLVEKLEECELYRYYPIIRYNLIAKLGLNTKYLL